MNSRTNSFVWAVSLLAALALGGMLVARPSVSSAELSTVLLLALLALIAEALAFLLPHAASGSVAFIPYLASILLVPAWPAVLAIAAVRALVEIKRRISLPKAVFNVAQHVLTAAFGIMLYRALGGEGLREYQNLNLQLVTKAVGLAAFAAITSTFLANTALVSVVIGLSTGQKPLKVWKENTLSSLGVDLLASPIVFIFAWVFAAFGAVAAVALWVPILGFRQLNKSNIELEQSNQELLQLMVKSIEARDEYTSGHSRRVQRYAVMIGRALQLPERTIERLGKAALLHDVGKIYEKYAPILRKPERLSSAEWITMQEHPIDGANLVATMSRLRELVALIRHHHENWDGTGYPDGLAGELIPLESRIIAFADTIDAMTSERPYRAALGEADVRQEIVRCRGRQFDPEMADKLLASTVWQQLFTSEREKYASVPTLVVVPRSRPAVGA